ncbi:hypothetical protein PInf_023578 [Phytophthora infestans]|nr:hypothetical protein PInf_023578 [Phytophthora infestans]
MAVDALFVEGAAGALLLSEEWMMCNGMKIDFTSCEVEYCVMDKYDDDARTVRIRMVRIANAMTSTCRRLELVVAAPEGTTGLIMLAHRVETHLLLAPTLTTVHDGKVSISVMNIVGRTTKLPVKEALGAGSPTSSAMEVLDTTEN